jgi:hypothetical protein
MKSPALPIIKVRRIEMQSLSVSEHALDQIRIRYVSFTGYKPSAIQVQYVHEGNEIIISLSHRDGHVRFGYNGRIVWDIYGRASMAFSGNPGVLILALESARQIAKCPYRGHTPLNQLG